MQMIAGLIHALPPSARRCFDRKEAASYIGVSVGTFDKLVNDGVMPGHLKFCGRKVWDRDALDRALDAASGLSSHDTFGVSEWDRVTQ